MRPAARPVTQASSAPPEAARRWVRLALTVRPLWELSAFDKLAAPGAQPEIQILPNSGSLKLRLSAGRTPGGLFSVPYRGRPLPEAVIMIIRFVVRRRNSNENDNHDKSVLCVVVFFGLCLRVALSKLCCIEPDGRLQPDHHLSADFHQSAHWMGDHPRGDSAWSLLFTALAEQGDVARLRQGRFYGHCLTFVGPAIALASAGGVPWYLT